MDKYVIVTWPESQDFIGRENCHLINDDEGYTKYGSSAYFVREDVYEKVMNLPHTPDYDNYEYGIDPIK
jgi:hypothetical protein